MLKATDFPRSEYCGYFEKVNIADGVMARVYALSDGYHIVPQGLALEKKCVNHGEADAWISETMADFKKEA